MSPRLRDPLLALLLASLALTAHARALGAALLHWDDHLYVWENPAVMGGLTWRGVVFAFTNTRVGPNWVPMAFLSHMLDAQIFGAHAWGHHLTSLLLHAANAGLLFAVLKRFTGSRWRSALVAAIFAVHPVHVESVAWVAERRDVLSLFFALLALLAYADVVRDSWFVNRACVRGLDPAGTRGLNEDDSSDPALNASHGLRAMSHAFRSYALVFLLTGLAVMSKPMMVTLPCLMLLLDYWPLRRLTAGVWWRLALEKLPLMFWTALSSAVTIVAQRQAMSSLGSMPLSLRVQGAVMGLGRYLGMLVWPVGLSPFYPQQTIYPMGQTAATVALLLAITAGALLLWRRAPYVLFGWLWFLGALAPVIGLVQVGAQAVACRYAYLPFIGLYVAVVWGAWDLVGPLLLWKMSQSELAAAAAAGLVLLGTLSWRETEPWLTTADLMTRAMLVSPRDGRAWFNLADALAYDGKQGEAVKCYRLAAEYEPTSTVFQGQLASAYLAVGMEDDARRRVRGALWLNPRNTIALDVQGQLLTARGSLGKAVEVLTRATEIDPRDAGAFFNLGVALADGKEMRRAAGAFLQATRLAPGNTDAWYYLGVCESAGGQAGAAAEAYERALALRPKWSAGKLAVAENSLGVALVSIGRLPEAVEHFRNATRLDPSNRQAAGNLERALVDLSRGRGPATQPE